MGRSLRRRHNVKRRHPEDARRGDHARGQPEHTLVERSKGPLQRHLNRNGVYHGDGFWDRPAATEK